LRRWNKREDVDSSNGLALGVPWQMVHRAECASARGEQRLAAHATQCAHIVLAIECTRVWASQAAIRQPVYGSQSVKLFITSRLLRKQTKNMQCVPWLRTGPAPQLPQDLARFAVYHGAMHAQVVHATRHGGQRRMACKLQRCACMHACMRARLMIDQRTDGSKVGRPPRAS
jgi:hypothetical protein